ncbi:MAG TPA: ROK family protein [Steroidobacteraceae bacterium]
MSRPKKILTLDVGGTHVKMRLSGSRTERMFVSGPTLTPRSMVATVRAMCADWRYDVLSIGYPGVVLHGKPVVEPHNLGNGWVGFSFAKAFGKPVRIVNDAVLQALGSYRRGRMLFLGLGTGLGSALIIDGVIEPTELAHLPYKHDRTYEEYVGERARKRLGGKKWRKAVMDVIGRLGKALEVDEVVVGGGNAPRLKRLPKATRRVPNSNAFIGGVRLWQVPEHPGRGSALLGGRGRRRAPAGVSAPRRAPRRTAASSR